MKIKAVAIMLVFSLFINLFPCFSDTANTTPEPYKEDEFPSWLFVVLDVELAYSLGTFAAHGFNTEYFKNPFASSSENAYTTEEQKNLLLISLGICLGIGITDFIVNRVKNSRRAKRALAQQNKNIQIEPISENPDATLIPPPNRDRKRGKKKSKETVQVQKVEEQTERDGTDISTDEIIDENPMEVETWVDE